MERSIGTNDWAFRWFCCILGLCVTNAFKARKYFGPKTSVPTFTEFVDELSCELTGLTEAQDVAKKARNKRKSDDVELSPADAAKLKQNKMTAKYRNTSTKPQAQHRIRSFNKSVYVTEGHGKEGKQKRCDQCGVLASFYCVDCSVEGHDISKYLALCGSQCNSDCISWHFMGV